jgi:hypothetical protein
LLSSTYDNLHGLLMKKSDIEICRCGVQLSTSRASSKHCCVLGTHSSSCSEVHSAATHACKHVQGMLMCWELEQCRAQQ